jgi:hypothetical protein
MGRAWQFWLTVFVVMGAFALMYYSSDYYAERAANGGKSPAAAESAVPAEGEPTQGAPVGRDGGPGIIPSNE